MNSTITNSLLLLVTVLLGGCATTGTQHLNLTLCTERSPVCTQNYDPVCGQHRDKHWQPYANACVACSKEEVVGYRLGECP